MADKNEMQNIIGYVFLGLTALFVILAVTTFDGTPTWMLIIGAIFFLVVAVFLIGGPGMSDGGSGGGSGQQQSVVLSGGRVVTQGGGKTGIMTVCTSCSARVPDGSKFCPDCGSAL